MREDHKKEAEEAPMTFTPDYVRPKITQRDLSTRGEFFSTYNRFAYYLSSWDSHNQSSSGRKYS